MTWRRVIRAMFGLRPTPTSEGVIGLTVSDLDDKSDEQLIDLLGLYRADAQHSQQIKELLALRRSNRDAKRASDVATTSRRSLLATTILGLATVTFAGAQVFFAWTSLAQQESQRVATYRGALDVRPDAVLVDAGTKPYVRVPLQFTNAGNRDMARLYVVYSHWDGGSWLGLLGWWKEGVAIAPTTLRGHEGIRAFVGAETRGDIDALLERGGRLYFAVRATWSDPNGRSRCSTVFIQISKTMTGQTAQGPKITTATILHIRPEGLEQPPHILVCQEPP